jgi:hypothetical protein
MPVDTVRSQPVGDEDLALVVDRAPEIVLHPVDLHEDLVETPPL